MELLVLLGAIPVMAGATGGTDGTPTVGAVIIGGVGGTLGVGGAGACAVGGTVGFNDLNIPSPNRRSERIVWSRVFIAAC